MIKQLAHVCLFSTDLQATEKFYIQTLGLSKGFDFIKENEVFGFYLKLGQNTFIEVFKGDKKPVGNIDHFAIEVEDIDKVINALQTNNYKASDKKLGADHSWQAWTEDPDGTRIEFHQYTAKSNQYTGGRCLI